MPRLSPRRGNTIAELLVALALATVVSALGATILLTAQRYAGRSDGDRAAERAVDEAAAVLAGELRAAFGDSIQLRGDTAADILAHVGSSVACVVDGATLVLPPEVAADSLPFSVWRMPPEAGDVLAAWDSSSPGAWRLARIDSVSGSSTYTFCGPQSGLVTAADSAARLPVVVLRLAAAPGSGVGVGAPLRVYRAGRWLLHRGSDRTWSLAYRRCSGPRGCSSAQPVAGPLAAAGDSGLVLALTGPRSLRLVLRAARQDRQLPVRAETLTVTIRDRAPRH